MKDKNNTAFFKKLLISKSAYSDSVKILAKDGYSDEYITFLQSKIAECKKEKDKQEGNSLLAQGYMFNGQLREALKVFETVDITKVPKELRTIFSTNYLLCAFLLGKTNKVKQIYEELNLYILGEDIPQMRRSVGIKEYVERRYENAVTVFVKLLEAPDPRATLFVDYCLVKSMIALDMYDEAKKIADTFSRYDDKKEITAEVKKVRNKLLYEDKKRK